MSGFPGYGGGPSSGAGNFSYNGYNIPIPVSNYMQQPQQQTYQHQPAPPPPASYGGPTDYWAQVQPQPQAQSAFGPNGEIHAPPEVGVDPNSFRRFFSQQLATLTFNSKPVITGLTLFAHQHLLRMSTIVSACLDEHLKTCPPSNRLPALYLLDSISKNIGPPYISLFCRFIERTFLSAYHVVDPPTKIKMEELLGTWRTGGSDGGELFRSPEEGRNGRVQHGIEQALFGTAGRGGGLAGGKPVRESESFQSGVLQHPTAASQDERSDVLLNVRRLLQIRQDQAMLNPDDPVNAGQITLLGKLESLVLNTTLSSPQIAQIRAQLQVLAPKEEFEVHPEPPRSPLPSAVQAILSPQRQQDYQSLAPPSMPQPNNEPGVPGVDPNLIAQLRGLAGGDLSSLLASTQAAAALAGATADADSGPDQLAAEYDALMLQLDVQLTNQDMVKYRPEGWRFLYERLGVQCKQCGLRFLQGKKGKKHMDVHLDWHFTHKRRVREGAGRAQGRSWFAMEEDWINSDTVDVSYDGADGAPAAGPSKPTEKVDRAELLKRKVVVPADKSKPCPICKEKFKEEWSEPDEEWVYYNAQDVDGSIVHATCHEGSSSRLASRLKLEDSARNSREVTPLGAPVPGSPGGSARKRKAGEGQTNGAGEEREEKKIKAEPV